jgi:dihydroorotase
MRQLTITRPDDWHIHLRDDDYLPDTVRDVARYFGRAIVMPNLQPPVDTAARAAAYRARILATRPKHSQFDPLMTLYITPQTNPATVVEAAAADYIPAFKLYPAGATTNSDAGVTAIQSLYPVFAAMQENAVALCIHGEVTNPEVDIFDREQRFIDETLAPICDSFPELKVIFEHITTSDAVQFVKSRANHVGATITAHHLLFNRNHLLAGGMRPIYYCLPVLKRNTHQAALIEAATSGDHRFFLGTDSAPHPRPAKENACGCAAGCYTAHAAIELYAEVFDNAGALDKLEGFASFHGPDFYGLPRNSDTITLVEKDWRVAPNLSFGTDQLLPIRGDEIIKWQVEGTHESN